MRRLLLPLLLPALVVPALAAAPAGAASTHHGRSGPAAAPAAVKSVLKQQGGVLEGRLTSSRAGCVGQKVIYLIVRTDGDDYPDIVGVAITNGKGKWKLSDARRRQGDTRLAALTLGNAKCDIAQSNQITYDPNRSGLGARPSRAGGLADVSITLQGASVDDIHGKITSSRDVCHAARPVFAFYRTTGSGDPYQAELISESRQNGNYFFEEFPAQPRAGRGLSLDLISVVPGTNNCRPAQSKERRFTS